MDTTAQLVLNVRLREDASFDNFLGETNRQALGVFQRALAEDQFFVLLHGGLSTGKSHLLHAACHQWQNGGQSIVNVPLADHQALVPEVLEGLEDFYLICLDDVDQVLGMPEWESALFHLYNRAQANGAKLLCAVSCSPARLTGSLPDLLSRLRAGVSVALAELSDVEKAEVLYSRASHRGLNISEELVRYIMSRSDRRLDQLMDTLQKLDDLSLSAKRKLTIPFVKAALDW